MLKKSFHKKKEVVFIYLGDLLFDARITNMAQSLIKNNYKVSFIGICNKPPSFSLYQNIKIYPKSISKIFEFFTLHNKKKIVFKNSKIIFLVLAFLLFVFEFQI